MFEEHEGDKTIAWTYEQICTGTRPWTALGNFMYNTIYEEKKE